MEKIFRGQTVKVTLLTYYPTLATGAASKPSHTMGKASMLKALMTILFRAKTTMASKRKAEVQKVYQGARVGRAQLALAHSTPEDSTEHTLC